MSEESGRPAALRWLLVLATVSCGIYSVIGLLSRQFVDDVPGDQRPILAVLALFAAVFALYLAAVGIVRRAAPDRRLLPAIVSTAFAFRLILLFSEPIQEIDIYRYLWDGAVSTTGISPFRFSPQQVLEAASWSDIDDRAVGANPQTATGNSADAEAAPLERLIALQRQPAIGETLRRVHYAELPTIYPPVGQAVFAVAARMTPAGATLRTRLLIMKGWFVAFDLATLAAVIMLLKACGRPLQWCLIYGWCPLLLKEVANSGHMDAIAVLLTTWAILLVVQTLLSKRSDPSRGPPLAAACVAAIVLALAVGAKLYPLILTPLLGLASWRRLGAIRTLLIAAVFVASTVLVLWPMRPAPAPASQAAAPVEEFEPPSLAGASPPPDVRVDPSLGVATFLRRWEMNDFLFMLLVENVRPSGQAEAKHRAWFVVTPERFRQGVVRRVAALGVSPREAPFLAARAVMAALFLGVALWLAWQVRHEDDPAAWCRAALLTIAWFWLLCPTQNPWYWTWALPLLPFARSRAWLWVSGFVLAYYLRFWLLYHYPEPMLGTPYPGPEFFDFVVTWFEFLPLLIWLSIDGIRLRGRDRMECA